MSTQERTKSTKPGRKIYEADYKTSICESLFEGYGCVYGSACSFAHSRAELRVRSSLYKTTACNDYPNCTRMYKCKFNHGEIPILRDHFVFLVHCGITVCVFTMNKTLFENLSKAANVIHERILPLIPIVFPPGLPPCTSAYYKAIKQLERGQTCDQTSDKTLVQATQTTNEEKVDNVEIFKVDNMEIVKEINVELNQRGWPAIVNVLREDSLDPFLKGDVCRITINDKTVPKIVDALFEQKNEDEFFMPRMGFIHDNVFHVIW